MHKIVSTVLLLSIGFFSTAQFNAVNYIDSLPHLETAAQVKTGDFNNDGLTDIVTLVSHFPSDSIRLYIASGNGQYSRLTITSIQNTGSIEYFETADINMDGWLDIAVITQNATVLTWYENIAGIFAAHPLAPDLDFTTQLLIKDFDHNGLPDILALQHVEIVLYRQSSAGVFEQGSLVHSGTEFYAIDAGYYNGDSLPDIAVASGGFEVLLNDGNGGFNLHSQAGLGLCFGLKSADLDNDSIVDIGMYESLRGILFYKNDGNGNFSFADTILQSTDNFETFGFVDFDCDSDNDLYTTIPQQGRLVWIENELTGGFSLPKNIHVQTGELVKGVYAGDINTDGKTDIIWGNKHVGINTNLNSCPLCVFTFASDIAGGTYQWELDNGSGFDTLINDGIHTGVTTNELKLTAPPTNWYGYKYRCIVDGIATGQEHILKFSTSWTGSFNTAWENAANWACGILPDVNTDVVIQGNATNYPQVNTNGFCRNLLLLPGAKLLAVPGAVLHITGR